MMEIFNTNSNVVTKTLLNFVDLLIADKAYFLMY